MYIGVIMTLNTVKGDYLPSDLGEWQAVFLSDGQVYFGQLKDSNKTFIKLTKVYYLKYGNSLQQNKNISDGNNDSNLNLIKLGGEIHAPEDSMYISKDKIFFIENMKDSSSVVTAIKSKL